MIMELIQQHLVELYLDFKDWNDAQIWREIGMLIVFFALKSFFF